MRILVLSLSLLFSFQGMAESAKGDGKMNFEQKKAEVLKGLDERIEALNKHKACVSAAATKEALRECHKQQRESMMNFRKEHMDGKMHRLENRKERLQKRMNKDD